MAELEIGFLLPLPGSPRAVFEGDYSYEGGRLVLDGTTVLQAHSRYQLECGVASRLGPNDLPIRMWLTRSPQSRSSLHVVVDEQAAVREDSLRAKPSRSAWAHAGLALGASAAGFVASYLYLLRASTEQSEWALKMGDHMAGWHLLLTFTLFPASVWGQRIGIRIVQAVSLLFFFIHLGIALANLGPDNGGGHGGAIAIFNGLSGLLFLAATLYGNRAYRDMDPATAWRAGRARSPERN